MIRLYKFFAYMCCSLLVVVLLWTGCNKALDINPPSYNIVSPEAFANDAAATSVMTGLYSTLTAYPGLTSGTPGISILEGLAADELTAYPLPSEEKYILDFYTNNYDVRMEYFWNEIYRSLYTTNAIIEGVGASRGLSTVVRTELLGEAKFMRAFFYFYAVQIYGAVPLALTTNYQVNNALPRANVEQVYAQIITDLKEAQSLLTDDYFSGITSGSTQRARPNRATATALLARVYLYTKDWANAEAMATALINNPAYGPELDLNKTFTAASKENIWYMQTVNNNNFSMYDAQEFILGSRPGTGLNSLAISPLLINSFEPDDDRFDKWVGKITDGGTTYYYPFKYQKKYSNTPEAIVVFRLSEQYLIRAEARAQQGNITGANSAQSDINIIRAKALLPGTVADEKETMLDAIAQERKIELFTEWGHRWFDLVRTGKADEVMSIVTTLKGGVWSADHQLLPIPYDETKVNPNIKQNPGYTN